MPYRAICREMGCDFTYTEMVSAKGLAYNNDNTRRLLAMADNEIPCAVQLFGREPGLMAETAKRLYDECGASLACIDINMGCPAQKIIKNGEGSALMLDEALAGRIVKALFKATPLPVTVKFRKGFDEAHVNALSFAKVLEDNGAAMLTLHARTRAQMYSGKADLAVIAELKEALSVPLIGNGDIFSAEDALRMRRETNCDGLMIARGAMGNPFIFREIKAALGGEDHTPPTLAERLTMAKEHTWRECEYKGRQGVIEMRKHLAWYIKGMRDAAAWRTRLNECGTMEETLALLEEYGEVLARH